jgi:MerR family redox-sensitive transcriptional activator SoxR
VFVRIGELAKHAGISTSAVRYYERVGLLPAPARSSGRRDYAAEALPRLAVILRARRMGFGISETRQLVSGFPPASPSARWRALAASKIRAMDTVIASARAMKAMLQLISQCRCKSWLQCGTRLMANPRALAGARSARVGP